MASESGDTVHRRCLAIAPIDAVGAHSFARHDHRPPQSRNGRVGLELLGDILAVQLQLSLYGGRISLRQSSPRPVQTVAFVILVLVNTRFRRIYFEPKRV